MRLDRFLKVSRLVKRRTVAKQVSDQHRVIINGRPAKAGTDVKPGDVLELDFGRRVVKVKVIAVRDVASTVQAREMYEVVSEQVREDWI
ncbi:MAG: RNA-binding S4 domain-containing protein [Bacillota bacterium]|jgi:ribosomal 50S subunit-recycling heat shock protein|nr:RNA-binding S4 domain-containing protein [Bacillota bacterium]